jgi:hypothetical protein
MASAHKKVRTFVASQRIIALHPCVGKGMGKVVGTIYFVVICRWVGRTQSGYFQAGQQTVIGL